MTLVFNSRLKSPRMIVDVDESWDVVHKDDNIALMLFMEGFG